MMGFQVAIRYMEGYLKTVTDGWLAKPGVGQCGAFRLVIK